jgi:predicted  nucleic acid-binding Zn-ribbon protein
MNPAASILQSLRNLARLDAEMRTLAEGSPEYKERKEMAAILRAPLPTSILAHYDKRIARGQLGIAPVNGGVCAACHLSLPTGRLADLRHKPKELNVCDYCGVFIYLAENEPAPAKAPSKTATTRKGSKSKSTR